MKLLDCESKRHEIQNMTSLRVNKIDKRVSKLKNKKGEKEFQLKLMKKKEKKSFNCRSKTSKSILMMSKIIKDSFKQD